MAKKNKGKNKYKENKKKEPNKLALGKYTDNFECLKNGEKRTLKDSKSDKNSIMPIEVCDEEVYLTEPDGKLIPNIQDQQKCDFFNILSKGIANMFYRT